MARNRWTGRLVLAAFVVLAGAAGLAWAADAQRPKNLLANPNFEMGTDPWEMDAADGCEARFTVEKDDARDGEFSALVTVDKVADYGVQLGQKVPAGRVGGTYTFAVLAKAVEGPAKIGLRVERGGEPWDAPGESEPVTLRKDQWTELHITFKVDKPYPEGWFAFVTCGQAKCRFRLDGARLYEGEYVAYQRETQTVAADAGVRLFDTGAASAESPFSGGAVAEERLDAIARGPGQARVRRRRGLPEQPRGGGAEARPGAGRNCIRREPRAGRNERCWSRSARGRRTPARCNSRR